MNDISQNMEQTEISKIPEVRTNGRKGTLKNKERAKVKRARDKHPLRESCSNSCQLQCNTKISQLRRYQIWIAFWKLSYNERKAFVFQCISRQYPKKIEKLSSKSKPYSNTYYSKDEFGADANVCKTFFLTTPDFDKKK